MSFGRSGTLVIAVFAGLAVLLAAGVLLRTPLQEVPIQIYPGYFYNDAGGYEKTIFYAGEKDEKLLIDARVDDYLITGGELLAARRPRITKLGSDDALDSLLLPECEYWVINLATGEMRRVPTVTRVHCQ